MNIQLTGKRAFVCGSTQGLGKATAWELAALGASVTLVARNQASLEKVAAELSTAAGQVHDHLCADFSEPEDLREKLDKYVAEHPPVHILVNNTGGPRPGPIAEAATGEFAQAFAQHLICFHMLAQALIPGMRQEGYGRIINITSTSVERPRPLLGVSNTIRAAVANWARTLAVELGPHGITVNTVLPGAAQTGRIDDLLRYMAGQKGRSYPEERAAMMEEIPARRFGEPAEIGAAIAFLASPAAAYINGVNLPVDGGRLAGP